MALPYYPDSVKILALFCFGCHHSPDCAAAPQIYLCVGVVRGGRTHHGHDGLGHTYNFDLAIYSAILPLI